MPDEDAGYARRGGRLLLPVLFWAGIGLAPLAGLLLLLGNGGSLRVGAFLGVLALVLIGLSIALRPDATAVRLQLEETLLEELDLLRGELRENIASASRATHQMVGERLGAVQQQLESLRGERARYAAPRSAAPAAAAAPGPPVRPPAQPPGPARPVAASHPVPPPPHPAAAAHPVGHPPAGRHPAAPPVSAPAAGNGRASVGGRRGARHEDDGHRAAPGAGRGSAPATGGVYRHTETVQVTTRSTYVDEHAPNGDGGGRHDGGYGDRDWSAAAPRGRAADAYEESWTDQKLRERYGRRPRPYDRADPDASAEQPWTADSAPWRPVSAAPVSAPRGGRRRRWDDDAPSELRLGERRAAARHSDQDGTELRLEERWASVRRDDNGSGRSDYRSAPDHPDSAYRDSYPGAGYRDSGYDEPDYHRPALPAASSEPSWNESWDEPVRQSPGHRYRPDFELSDERWR